MMNGSGKKVVCYERVCYEPSVVNVCFINESVMNVVCFEWSGENRSILQGNRS